MRDSRQFLLLRRKARDVLRHLDGDKRMLEGQTHVFFEPHLYDYANRLLPHERPHFLRRPLLQLKAMDHARLFRRPSGESQDWPVLQHQLPRIYRPRLPRQGPDPLQLRASMQLVTVRRVRPLTLFQAL